MLDVDEIETRVGREPSRFDIVINQSFEIIVAGHDRLIIGIDPKLLIENGMVGGRSSVQVLLHWDAQIGRVREL